MQAQHAHIKHAHAPLRAKTHSKAGTLGGVTLQRPRPRLTRMRQLCAVAVWALHVRLWHRLEHTARQLALRWVPAVAELPAMAQRNQLNQQLHHAHTACATPFCRHRRLGSVMGSQWACQRILPLGLQRKKRSVALMQRNSMAVWRACPQVRACNSSRAVSARAACRRSQVWRACRKASRAHLQADRAGA